MKGEITIQEAALRVVRRLREHGHQAYWAGGSVRDMLLGLDPADIDVATDAPPERIVELFRRTRHVGIQFGVVLVSQGRRWIETATFRTDLSYADGRRPEAVVFTTAEEDAQRRDFTINGLFYDPIEHRVIDYVRGQEDLRAGIVRAIGEPERRFAEDHLRMLRAVRFATRFAFRLDEATAAAINAHAQQITRISPERIREELEKMFAHPARAESLKMIANLGLLPHLWPGSDWPPDRVERACAILRELPPHADFVLSLGALLSECSASQIEKIGRALRCSNQQIADATWLLASQGILADPSLPDATLKKLMASPRFEDLLALHRAIAVSQGRALAGYEAALSRRAAIRPVDVAPPPFVSGEDLIAAGLQPGPGFKQILTELYDAQLNSELTDRPSALRRLNEMIRDRR